MYMKLIRVKRTLFSYDNIYIYNLYFLCVRSRNILQLKYSTYGRTRGLVNWASVCSPFCFCIMKGNLNLYLWHHQAPQHKIQ